MSHEYDSTITLNDGAPDDAEALLEKMLEIRHFEDEVMGLFSKNLVRGSTHLCQGQEAITVGVASVTIPGDTMTCTYRGHGATIAHGAALNQCFGEILGRAGGIVGGRGGSMHFTDMSIGALGSNGIVGAHLPITVGAALTASYLNTGGVSIAYFGDGSTNIGAFHESLNLASVWKLPAIFVLENNQYGEYSSIAMTTPIERLSQRADAYGMNRIFVDGNDVVAVRAAAEAAMEHARNGGGPTLIEADTYRHHGHSRSDPAKYRPADEVEHWLSRDPITNLVTAMHSSGRWDAAATDEIIERVKGRVLAARDEALSWPEPPVNERFEDVYA